MSDSSSATQQGYTGFAPYGAPADDHTVTKFHVEQVLGRISTMKLVQIVAVHPGAGLAPGRVDVQPLVHQIDGMGNSTPHGVINSLIYFRLQGGAAALICDPVVGDKGFAVFADRDSSSAVASGGQANPGSFRRFDMADGVYIGGCVNDAPTVYLEINQSGTITAKATTLVIQADIVHTGTITSNGKNIGSTHIHTGGTLAGGDTGVPV